MDGKVIVLVNLFHVRNKSVLTHGVSFKEILGNSSNSCKLSEFVINDNFV